MSRFPYYLFKGLGLSSILIPNCFSLLKESDVLLTFLAAKASVLPRILQFSFIVINSLSVKLCKFVPVLKVCWYI